MSRGKGLGAGVAALLALTIAGAPVVAQDAGAPSGTLTIAIPGDASTMDPQMHRVRITQTIAHARMESLFYQKPPGLAFQPLLAESITRVDDTHYDVKLREGVKFHSGGELTSEDVVYTFRRLWDPANKSPRASMGNMPNVEGIEAIDKYTVRFTTKIPFGTADQAIPQLALNNQQIMPKAFYENLSLEEARTSPGDGAGPFKLVEWVPDTRMVMVAHHDYWQGPPKVENLIWRVIPEETTRVAELLAGSVDIISPVTPDFVQQLRDAGMVLEVQPGTASTKIEMNVREGSPFHDLEVRRAMNMAIDKQAIVDNLFQGLALAFEQVPGVGQEGFIEGYDPFPYDPEAARAVLSKVTEPIDLYVTGSNLLAAEVIAEQLRSYGMNVSAREVDSATLEQRNTEGTFDLMITSTGYASGDFVGSVYTNKFQCSRLQTNLIGTGYCNPELDEMVAAVRAETDPQKRAATLEEVIKILSERDVPWVPLYGVAEVAAMQPHVKGFVVSSAGQWFDLQNISVEK